MSSPPNNNSHTHHRGNVSSSSGDGDESRRKDHVSTTTTTISSSSTNEDINNSNTSSSSSSTSDLDDSNSNGPTSTTTSTTTPPSCSPASSSSSHNILRPSILLRPSTFNNSSSSSSSASSPGISITPPQITITPSDQQLGSKVGGSMSFLRPSKLLVKESPTSPGSKVTEVASCSSAGDEKPTVFVPLTKDVNSVNGESSNKSEDADGIKPDSGSSGGGEFLFGEKLEDRVSSSQSERKRKISDGDEEQASSSKVPALEDVDVSTGEEGEINVMQVPCRLYNFDPTTTNWTERVSRGVLRLNDTDSSNSRLIVRSQGSLRLMLNTKIFNGMVVERPNEKSVKFTAVDIQDEASAGGVKVFLVMGSYSDMDSLYNAINNRLRRFNQQ